MAKFKISFGRLFLKEFQHFPEEDKDKIAAFVAHIKENGFIALEGLNKKSNDVDKNDPKFLEKVSYANTHNLWHYHIGIKQYNTRKTYGERTSEYVLHYQLLGDEIRIIDYSPHPPFNLPSQKYLK
ncbi:hypothetical protein ACLQ90_02175 [Avibacterium paragallinarum]|uniref:Putative phage associated protein n=1 Tax=Avibacterium paragallinarum TaxID=728 RepID=A0A0F5F0W3_AVIPA|nr:hypothetical protein [Avibacterium paragallinarum]KAA6209757.1 hypothetical protein F1968_02295 [Avibacterium paragallinarum]KKB02411.1 hypothetical protein Z012_01120 [Avibacterium paragallinarum]MEE3607719.1 hypothetical protein [Avibacterium paragallinarum]MEE3620395.1 hypothetical protein [Avibacterium paragallinarum]MEE3668416.1 hypothetical protein [Avibacterium paragallinarum]